MERGGSSMGLFWKKGKLGSMVWGGGANVWIVETPEDIKHKTRGSTPRSKRGEKKRRPKELFWNSSWRFFPIFFYRHAFICRVPPQRLVLGSLKSAIPLLIGHRGASFWYFKSHQQARGWWEL